MEINTEYNEILRKAKQIFGNKIPIEYYDLIEILQRANDNLEYNRKNSIVTPSDYQHVETAKADIFDMLNSEGFIIIGKITYSLKNC